ncbi:MAG: cytochrome c [Burkholderiaceae bacterium]
MKAVCRAAALVMLAIATCQPRAAGAADPQAGRGIADRVCANCHGSDGIATFPGAPNLAGQPEEYSRRQLHDYQSGARRNEQMSVVVKGLSEADIENLSAWYAAMRVTVELPDR